MYETIRIVGQVRPKYVLWENVKNILSKKHKHNFDAYIETMKVLGYNSYYKVLDAKDYGVPQHRERVYTISIRKDIDRCNFKFPEPVELKLRLKDMLEKQVDEKYYLSDVQIERIKTTTYNVGKTRIQEKDYCDTLCARDWKDPKCVQVGNLQGENTEPKVMIKNATKKGYDEATDGDSVNLQYPDSNTRRGRVGHQISQTLMANDNIGVVIGIKVIGNYMPSNHDASRIVDSDGLAPTVKENHGTVTATNTDYRIRKLTPKECWRLMGFDDEDFEKAKNAPMSNTQLYKQARKFYRCKCFRKNIQKFILGGNMENKVIAKEYVDKNYISKEKIKNKIKDLTEHYEKEVKPEMYHWGDFTAEEYYAGVIAELNMLLEDK